VVDPTESTASGVDKAGLENKGKRVAPAAHKIKAFLVERVVMIQRASGPRLSLGWHPALACLAPNSDVRPNSRCRARMDVHADLALGLFVRSESLKATLRLLRFLPPKNDEILKRLMSESTSS
jgi:hypothetical protein